MGLSSMASTLDLLRRLVDHGVEFVLVGGMAAAAHGSSVVTEDVDVCIRFDLPTLTRLLDALRGSHPRQRMQPQRSALSADPAAYLGWHNLYLVTDEGQLDVLSEISGVGPLEALLPGSLLLDLGGFGCRVMGVEDLIRAKRALGRPKDLRAALELEAVRRKV
jgi:predicted nucleotidyltransferase